MLIGASTGLVNLILSTIVVSVVFVQLPTAVGPLDVGAAGFVGAWLIVLLLVLGLALWMRLYVMKDELEG